MLTFWNLGELVWHLGVMNTIVSPVATSFCDHLKNTPGRQLGDAEVINILNSTQQAWLDQGEHLVDFAFMITGNQASRWDPTMDLNADPNQVSDSLHGSQATSDHDPQ